MGTSGSFEFKVDEKLDIPLWVQLKNRMVYLIEQSFFAPGDQLPTVRGLASELAINYNTVNKVYLSLAADGYIESSRGRGAFVLDVPRAAHDDAESELEELMDDFIESCTSLGLSYDDISVRMSRKLGKLKYEQEHGSEGKMISMKSARQGVAKRAGGQA